MITSLSKDRNIDNKYTKASTQNSTTQKTKKHTTNNQETQIIVHILCECSTHIIKVIQTQMHDSQSSIETKLHSLLLPNDKNKIYSTITMSNDNDMELEDNEMAINMLNDDNMQLLKSLLSIFTSCCLIFEQFAKKNKYSAMSMVLTLCDIISDCLCDHTLKQLMSDYLNAQQKELEKHKKNKKKKKKHFKVNDLRLFISKSLMSLFNVFPVGFVEEMESEHDEDNDSKMDINKQQNNRMNVMRINMKTIKICHQFVEYWNLNLLEQEKDDKNNKKMDYFSISYQWINTSLLEMGSNENGNTKIIIDLLQILKKMIGFYDETKQLQLLLSVDKLLKNSAFINDAKTIFDQFVN